MRTQARAGVRACRRRHPPRERDGAAARRERAWQIFIAANKNRAMLDSLHGTMPQSSARSTGGHAPRESHAPRMMNESSKTLLDVHCTSLAASRARTPPHATPASLPNQPQKTCPLSRNPEKRQTITPRQPSDQRARKQPPRPRRPRPSAAPPRQSSCEQPRAPPQAFHTPPAMPHPTRQQRVSR